MSEDGTNDIIKHTLLAWRARLAQKLREAAVAHPPAGNVDLDDLADHLVATFEGAFVIARATGVPNVMRKQLELVRNLVALSLGVESHA